MTQIQTNYANYADYANYANYALFKAISETYDSQDLVHGVNDMVYTYVIKDHGCEFMITEWQRKFPC
jgi:hypothetical protein